MILRSLFAGKTFTMQGTNEQPGIIPRALREVFAKMRSQVCACATPIQQLALLSAWGWTGLVDVRPHIHLAPAALDEMFFAHLLTHPNALVRACAFVAGRGSGRARRSRRRRRQVWRRSLGSGRRPGCERGGASPPGRRQVCRQLQVLWLAVHLVSKSNLACLLLTCSTIPACRDFSSPFSLDPALCAQLR